MFRFRAIVATLILVNLFSNAWADTGSAVLYKSKIDFQIPSKPLEEALVALSIQADLNIIGLTENLKQFQAQSIQGSMTLQEALEKLLEGTSPYL